jgi:hypothetical protein
MVQGLEALQYLRLPDEWQAEAVRGLKDGFDVIVHAPTGAGKTLVFEQFALQARPGQKMVYTVPTRALANDKYAEWLKKGWRVGLTTGDIVLDPDAPIVVATLEAQQEAQGASLFVVDEYQWLGDEQRGNHYEAAIMDLPVSTQLLLLSGSVANPEAVQRWLERLGRRVQVVKIYERPVPLEEVEAENLARRVSDKVGGFWMRVLAGALREDMGPILVFAPHRKDAEKLARHAAAALPLVNPLELTPEQEQLAGPEMTKLLHARVAFHHSGLSYTQRAGLIEPLAKAGQLRVVVATLGLSAGINFSLRSVLVTATSFTVRGSPREVQPAELLQMFGRAGRRGLDEIGYVLVTSQSARLSQGRPEGLRRGRALPWRPLLRALARGEDKGQAALAFQARLFTERTLAMGVENTAHILEPLPCGLKTDTGRARLVRRESNPAPFCLPCAHRSECLELSTTPTLLWLWNRLGILDKNLELTRRGWVVSQFSGAEGLGVVAGLEDETYPLEELVEDVANLAAGDRFSGEEGRWGGRLGEACRKVYKKFSSEGFLEDGVPLNYGYGGAEIISALRTKRYVPAAMLGEWTDRGDVDRLVVEWRSLLRQVAGAEEGTWSRWQEFRLVAKTLLEETKVERAPIIPSLTAGQQKVVSHQLRI